MRRWGAMTNRSESDFSPLPNVPAQHAECVENRPNGPLEVSYLRTNRGKLVPERMDYIFISSDLGVRSVGYHYYTSRSAGSDHGLVMAELTIE